MVPVRCIVVSILVAVSLLEFSSAQLLCNEFTVDDLGSRTMITADVGLLPEALSPPGETVTRIPVMIQDYNVVCNASGSRRTTSSYVSVVVQFVCRVSSSPTASLQDCDGSTSIIRQYQFRCASTDMWVVTTVGNIETLNPSATLNTTQNDRCVSCVDATQSFIDPVTHCSACPSNINCNQGQMRCYQGPIRDQCCNYYMNNECVATCPDPLVGDGMTFDCGCGQLSLDNGTVTYTARYAIGSVATYTCDAGYRRVGDATRDCTTSGWDDRNITCEFIQCSDLAGTIENGAVTIDPLNRGVNSKATYSCDGDYELKNGDRERNCLVDGAWDGTPPKCNKKSDSGLSPGVIAGIVIGAVAFVLIVTAITVAIAILINKYGKGSKGEEVDVKKQAL